MPLSNSDSNRIGTPGESCARELRNFRPARHIRKQQFIYRRLFRGGSASDFHQTNLSTRGSRRLPVPSLFAPDFVLLTFRFHSNLSRLIRHLRKFFFFHFILQEKTSIFLFFVFCLFALTSRSLASNAIHSIYYSTVFYSI